MNDMTFICMLLTFAPNSADFVLASDDGTYIMTVNADNTVTDLPAFKHFLLLYKNLSDDGKMLLVILGVSEQGSVLPMDSLCMRRIIRRLSILVLEAFLFLFLQ